MYISWGFIVRKTKLYVQIHNFYRFHTSVQFIYVKLFIDYTFEPYGELCQN